MSDKHDHKSDWNPHHVFGYRDPDHTPYSKRPGQIHSSVATVEIAATREWIELRLAEITTSWAKDSCKPGNVASHTICVELHNEYARKLYEALHKIYGEPQ